MYYGRIKKQFLTSCNDDIVVVGKKDMSEEDLREYLSLEEKIGSGDYFVTDSESVVGYWEALPTPELKEADFSNLKWVCMWNADERLDAVYNLSEQWIVTIGEDGVFSRGNKTPLRDYIEALLSQKRLYEIVRAHQAWATHGPFPDTPEGKAIWNSIQKMAREKGLPTAPGWKDEEEVKE